MNLIDGKYTLPQIVDLQQFQTLLENFTRATGFTTALVSYPDQQLLITTGWRDVCTKFHRANWASAQHCVSSNRLQSQALAEQRLLNICPCENGLVDGATPVIIHGTHVASLATGQIFFAPPDEARFLRQAEQYGFDPDAYLAAVRAVPVVTEAQFEAALCFLRELAQLLAEQAIANLDSQATAEALRSSETRARAILEAAEVGLLIVDAETHEILSVNPKALALFETTEEHLLHRVCHRFICPAEVGKCPITDLKQVVDTSERELLNVRGESRPILKSVREIQLDGRACLLESYIDITAQKRVEAELQAANAQMHALLSAIPDLLFEYDREGRVLSFQTNDPSQLSLHPEQFLGHTISDILPAAVADKITAGLTLAATEGFARNIEYQLTQSGVTRWYEMAISRCDPAGNRFLAVSRNITERIQAQQVLHDLQQQFKYLVDHTSDFIIQVDMEGNYCYCNAASEGFIGYTTSELLQMNIRQITAPEYHALLFARLRCRKLKQAIDERPYQIELLHRDGHRVWAELTTTVVYDAEQRPIAVQAIARNIDERKRFEQRLTALRDGFLHFGPDPVSNINRLTALAGELLTASCAIYHRLEGDGLHAVGCWHTPPDFPPFCAADGCICAQGIARQSPEPCVLHDLPHSPYAATDPHVRRYGLQTYIGYPVALQNANIGSLSVVYRQEYAPSDDDLQLLGILAMAIGIEELRRQAIRELAESEERYKALIQNAVEGIAAMNPKTERLKFFNPAFCAMFGYTADECANLALPDFHPLDIRSKAQEEFQAVARGEDIDLNAIPCRRKDGSIFYADITGAPIVLEGEPCLMGFFTDSTERKRVEAERLEMERRLLHSAWGCWLAASRMTSTIC